MEENQPKKEEMGTPKPLEFQAGTFSVRIFMEGGQINFKAYSDLSRKILKCTFEDKDLKPEDRGVFEDCEGGL